MAEGMAVQLFAPGLDPAGAPARAWFASGVLRLAVEGGQQIDVAVSGIELKTGGFDGRQWLLQWRNGEGAHALMLPPGDAAERWLAAAPGGLAGHAARAAGRHRLRGHGFRLGMAAIALAALLPLVLVLLFWLNAERVAGWAAGHVTLEQERQLGDMAFAQMRPTLKLLESGPAPEMVAAIGQRLTRGSRYHYQWFVADSPEVNAFAIPGGHVVVYTGLLKAADGPEEVAGVLAHEVQHVELRHSLKNMLHALGWQALLALALGDLSGGVWANMAGELGNLGFGRDLEREADLAGLAALKAAGIAPQGMASFFTKLAGKEGARIEMLSTHPASEARMAALNRAIAAQGPYPAAPLPFDWAAVTATLR